jgi:hypothetical protein
MRFECAVVHAVIIVIILGRRAAIQPGRYSRGKKIGLYRESGWSCIIWESVSQPVSQ